jgi:phage-related protein (TIGR01555 family)
MKAEWLRRRLRAWLEVPEPTLAVDHHRRAALAVRDPMLLPPEPDPYRYKLQLPKLPEGVREAAGMAMDDAGPGGFPNLSFLNSIAGLNAFGLYFPGYPLLAELAQRTEYRQPTETVAKEMTRKWITFKSKGAGDKSERIAQIEDDFEEFKIQALFRKATEHDGFYGLGHIFIDLKGPAGADHSLPLLFDEQTISQDSLNGFTTIEPMWATPLVWNSTDPTHPNFYKPESWQVLGQRTHQSRMLRFVSREVPDIIKPAYNFGGISLSQLIDPYVGRWLKTVDSVNRLINTFSIIFLQTDMAEVLAGGDSSELIKRLRLFTKTRDNQAVFMTDKEKEMLEQLAVPLAGLSELQAQAQEHMAMPTHLPLVVLTGITPAGLNASSEEEIEVFHDWNHSMQEALYTDPLKKVLTLVQLNRFGNVDPDIIFDYVPLKELVGEAAARVRKMASEAGIAYIDAGVISPEEERQRITNDPESGYDNLSGSDVPEPPAQEEPEPGEEEDEPTAAAA